MTLDSPSSPSASEHKVKASGIRSVRMGLVTVSDTRTEETDKNGRYLREEVERRGDVLVGYRIVRDEPAEVESALDSLLAQGCEVAVFNGGTGIGPRDTTIDGIQKRLDKEIPGFGEIFRMLSYKQIGSAAILSRALAGLIGKMTVFCLPGSHQAVRLAWKELIEPELKHLVWEQDRSRG